MSTFRSFLVTIITAQIFLSPLVVSAQPTQLTNPYGRPEVTQNRYNSSLFEDNIYGEIAQGSLSLAVCSGGNLTDRLKAAGQGAVTGAFAGVANWGLTEVKNWISDESTSKLIQGLVGGVAEVAFPVVGGILSGVVGNLLGLGGSSGPQMVTAPELEAKEGCLDAMARVTSQQILQYVAQGVLTWVQRGVESQTAGFVQDIDKHLRGAADRQFRKFMVDFMSSKAYGDICDAFSDDVAAAIPRDYYKRYPEETVETLPNIQALINATQSEQCGFNTVLGGGADQFATGMVETESWSSWNELVRKNPYYQYVMASNDLESGIGNAQNQSIAELAWSGGFISWRECKVRGEPSTNPPGFWLDEQGKAFATMVEIPDQGEIDKRPCTPDGWVIQTPGSVTNNLINEIISSDIRRGELADEFNEIVADAGDWLISNILEEGLSNAAPGLAMSGGSLEAQINEERRGLLYERVAEQISIEKTFLNNLEPLVATLEDKNPDTSVEQMLGTLATCSTADTGIQTRARTLRTYLYTELNEYSTFRQKISWKGESSNFEWKPLIINRTEPMKINWKGELFDWQPGNPRSSEVDYVNPGDDIRCENGENDKGGYKALKFEDILNTARESARLNIDDFNIIGYIPDFFNNLLKEFKKYDPYYELPWQQILLNELERSPENSVPTELELSPEYQYLWEAYKCEGDRWRNTNWNDPRDWCKFDPGEKRCYFPAFTPRKAEISQFITYREDSSGNTIQSQCKTLEDAGGSNSSLNHYLVFERNGEYVWGSITCTSVNLAGGSTPVQWQHESQARSNPYQGVNPAERLLLGISFVPKIGAHPRLQAWAPAYGLVETDKNPITEQEDLIAKLEQAATFLEGGLNGYNQAYNIYTEIENRFHTLADVSALQGHITFVAAELSALNERATSLNCGGSPEVADIAQNLAVFEQSGPKKLDWNGIGFGWTATKKYVYKAKGTYPETNVIHEEVLEVYPICERESVGKTYAKINPSGDILGSQYRDSWEVYQCQWRGRTTAPTAQEESRYYQEATGTTLSPDDYKWAEIQSDIPAWKLY